jgi:nitrogen regulatory protein P-II 1
MYMLVMVVDDVAHLPEVLEAWISAGVKGVTVLESTGVNRVLKRTQARAMFMGFSQLFGETPVGHNTLFAIIDSLDVAEAAVAATEDVIGDLTQPHTGIIVALPVARAWGLPDPYDEDIDEATTG